MTQQRGDFDLLINKHEKKYFAAKIKQGQNKNKTTNREDTSGRKYDRE